MDIEDEMKIYYEKRAGEYEEWYLRKNRFDKGETLNRKWFHDLEELKVFALSIKNKNIIELAAGTGMWTQYLAKNNCVLPIDSSASMLKINQKRTGLEGIVGDIYDFQIDLKKEYDLCFFGFWLSHVPKEKITTFFIRLRSLLKSTARVIIFDSYLNPNELNCLSYKENIQIRALNSGETFNVYKKYYTKDELIEIAKPHFKSFKIQFTENYFYMFDGNLNPK
jgi:ubiquinone/menaquinone biosynthesis C-methylase UbiE